MIEYLNKKRKKMIGYGYGSAKRARDKYNREKTKMISVRMSNELYEAIINYCNQTGMTKNGIFLSAVKEKLERDG